jgi:hypothetical protein
MTMQNNIDTLGRNFRRNMHQPKLQFLARKIDNERPILVPIAIPAHDRERRTDRFELERDCRFANIAQMPDFVRLTRKIDNLLRQLVMRVGNDKNSEGIHFRTAGGADKADITSGHQKIIRLNPSNPRLASPCVIQ